MRCSVHIISVQICSSIWIIAHFECAARNSSPFTPKTGIYGIHRKTTTTYCGYCIGALSCEDIVQHKSTAGNFGYSIIIYINKIIIRLIKYSSCYFKFAAIFKEIPTRAFCYSTCADTVRNRNIICRIYNNNIATSCRLMQIMTVKVNVNRCVIRESQHSVS